MKFAFFLLALASVPAFRTQAADNSVSIFLTAKDSAQRLADVGESTFNELAQPTEKQDAVIVDSSKTFQTIIGIGGALTDASAETFFKLPAAKQEELLKAYFDPREGIGYSLGRTPIHSCDFSSASYTYVKDDDAELKTFDISHDLKFRVPFIKRVLAVAGQDFSIYASPWSPPAWMKSNDDMLHGGSLKPEFAASWANYFVKFIQAYEAVGIPIWGLTIQNEPMAVQRWESCIFTAEKERDFLKNFLGPTLVRAGMKDKKIMIWDHNRGLLYQRAKVVLDDPDAAKYVWGVGYHWYVGDHFENAQRVREAYPKINLFFTEGCHGPFRTDEINDWKWGELYATSMIHDFNCGVAGWTDWNVLLDERGGPNHVANFCFAPVHGDTQTGRLTYMNSFYYIGHFSKFVRPGARRIISSSTVDELQTTAFLNPDGKVAVVVMNATEKARPFLLWTDGRAAKISSPAHSILTAVYSASKSEIAAKEPAAAGKM
jgi:glucosylceramidase